MADVLTRGLRGGSVLDQALVDAPVMADPAGGMSQAERGLRAALAGQGAAALATEGLQAEIAGNKALATEKYRQADIAKRDAAAFAPRVGSLKDVHGVDDFADYIAGGLPQVLTSTAPALAGALVGRGLGGRAGMMLGGMVPAYNMEANETIGNLAQDPQARARMTPEEIQSVGRVKGGVNSLLEVAGPAYLINRALSKEAAREGLRGAAKTVGMGGLMEGPLTELPQEMVGAAAETFAKTGQADPLHDPWRLADATVQGMAGGHAMAVPAAGAQVLQGVLDKGVQAGGKAVEKTVELGQQAVDGGIPLIEEGKDKAFDLYGRLRSGELKSSVLDTLVGRTPPAELKNNPEGMAQWLQQYDTEVQQTVEAELTARVNDPNASPEERQAAAAKIQELASLGDPMAYHGYAQTQAGLNKARVIGGKLKDFAEEYWDRAKAGAADGMKQAKAVLKKNEQVTAAQKLINDLLVESTDPDVAQTDGFRDSVLAFSDLFAGKLKGGIKRRAVREFFELYGENAMPIAEEAVQILARENPELTPKSLKKDFDSTLKDALGKLNASVESVRANMTNEGQVAAEQQLGRKLGDNDYREIAEVMRRRVEGSIKGGDKELSALFGGKLKNVENLFRTMHDVAATNESDAMASEKEVVDDDENAAGNSDDASFEQRQAEKNMDKPVFAQSRGKPMTVGKDYTARIQQLIAEQEAKNPDMRFEAVPASEAGINDDGKVVLMGTPRTDREATEVTRKNLEKIAGDREVDRPARGTQPDEGWTHFKTTTGESRMRRVGRAEDGIIHLEMNDGKTLSVPAARLVYQMRGKLQKAMDKEDTARHDAVMQAVSSAMEHGDVKRAYVLGARGEELDLLQSKKGWAQLKVGKESFVNSVRRERSERAEKEFDLWDKRITAEHERLQREVEKVKKPSDNLLAAAGAYSGRNAKREELRELYKNKRTDPDDIERVQQELAEIDAPLIAELKERDIEANANMDRGNERDGKTDTDPVLDEAVADEQQRQAEAEYAERQKRALVPKLTPFNSWNALQNAVKEASEKYIAKVVEGRDSVLGAELVEKLSDDLMLWHENKGVSIRGKRSGVNTFEEWIAAMVLRDAMKQGYKMAATSKEFHELKKLSRYVAAVNTAVDSRNLHAAPHADAVNEGQFAELQWRNKNTVGSKTTQKPSAAAQEKLAAMQKATEPNKQQEAIKALADKVNESALPSVQKKKLLAQLREAYKADPETARAVYKEVVAALPGKKSNEQEPAPAWGFKGQDEAREYVHRALGNKINLEFKRTLGGISGEWESGDTVNTIRIAMNAGPGMLSVAYHESMHEFFARLTKHADVKDLLLRVSSSEAVMRQLKRLLAAEPAALKAIENDPEERLAYAYQFWAQKKADGARMLNIMPAGTGVFKKIANFFRSVTGLLSAEQRADAILGAFYDGKMATKSSAGKVIGEVMSRGENAQKFLRTMKPLYDKAFNFVMPSYDVLVDSNNGYAKEIASMFYTPLVAGDSQKAGFINATRMFTAQWDNRFADIISDLNKEEVDMLREVLSSNKSTTFEPVQKAAGEVRTLLRDFYKYSTARGVKLEDRGPEYFPRVWDYETIAAEKDRFIALLKKYGYDETPADTLSLLSGVETDHGTVTEREDTAGYSPYMQAINKMKLGRIDDADPEAQYFLEKDMIKIMTSYLKQGVRRAEYETRFGEGGKKLTDLLSKAYDVELERVKKENPGIEEKEAVEKAMGRHAQYADAAHAMEGTIGHDKLGPGMRKFNSWMIAYQNMRLLPLVLFSSMIDPLGFIVRGGSVSDAFEAYKRGVAEVLATWTGKEIKDEKTKLAELMGTIEHQSFLDTLGYVHESMYMDSSAKKLSDTFFKWNGMEAWNRAMRTQATVTAISFIKEHATNPGEHSARWLKELGLSTADVKILSANGELALSYGDFMLAHAGNQDKARAAAEKMQLAVNHWVDGSMLRPNAALRPSWSSDPRFSLLFYLKQFTYTFHKTFLSRVRNEYQHGNTEPMVAMLPFIPMMIASDVFRGVLQNGGELPQYMQGWGPGDYLLHGVQRAGLTGIGQFGIEELQHPLDVAGPVVGQAIDLFTQPAGENLRKAVPGLAVANVMAD